MAEINEKLRKLKKFEGLAKYGDRYYEKQV